MRHNAVPAMRSVGVLLIVVLLVLALSGCAEKEITSAGSLVAYWAFDEGTGTTAADNSGNKNSGTLHGATWVEGKTGKALQFDGTQTYMEAKDANTLDLGGAFTIAAWVRLAELGRGRQVLMQKNPLNAGGTQTNYTLYAQWTHDALALVIGDGKRRVGYLSDRGLGSAGTWHHVAVVFGNGEVRFYIDGQPAGTRKTTMKPHVNTGPLIIGRYTTQDHAPSFHLKGSVDELRIYSKALTHDEVKKLAGVP